MIARALSLSLALVAAVLGGTPVPSFATTYFVRQTVGDDGNDGLAPERAWRSISKLDALRAGDTAYVGPGLYRDEVMVRNSGTSDQKLIFIADSTGQHTGDPPGIVMIAGSCLQKRAFYPLRALKSWLLWA